MSQATENSLQKIIDDQNIRIQTYKSKLRDVVQAYKDINKEKLALESTITALLSDQTTASLQRNETTSDADKTVEENASICEASEVENNLKKQILTLTENLVSMTSQKNKLEATYIAEKKMLRQEFDNQNILFKEEIVDLNKKSEKLLEELELYKRKLNQQQTDHENESKNYAIMLRELQTIVNTERLSRENAESKIEDLIVQLDEKTIILQQSTEEFQKRETELKKQIAHLVKDVEDNKVNSLESQKLLDLLNKELLDAKQVEATRAHHSADNLDDKIKQLKASNERAEQRVCDLEREVTQLAMTVGEAQRSKLGDLNSIQSLKDKCNHLQQENIQLSTLFSNQCKSTENLSIAELIEEIKINIDRLKAKNYDLNQINDSIDSLNNLHTKCHEKYDQLNEEFEKYKLRAQSVLKTKSKDTIHGSDREILSLQNQVAEYKEKATDLRQLLEEKNTEMQIKEDMLKSTAEATTLKLQRDIDRLQNVHNAKIREMENELRLMRERTINLLSEKDEELRLMKESFSSRNRIDATDGFISDESPQTTRSEKSFSDEIVQEILEARQRTTSPRETPLLYDAEEKSRLQLQLASLGRQKQQLQFEARELQRNLAFKETEFEKKIESLQERLDKVNRDAKREDANLEYLKNVILRYISSDNDIAGKKGMLNAIATILQFSPDEKKLVLTKANKYWWK